MDLRLVLGQHPILIIIGSTATMFKGTELGEATLNGAAISSMVIDHNTYTEVTKSPQYGTCKDCYIEGPTTSYDASRYQYGTGSSTYFIINV